MLSPHVDNYVKNQLGILSFKLCNKAKHEKAKLRVNSHV